MKRFIFLLLVPIPVTVLAQTETTEWWVNGEVYATTSCETGGDISVPTNPSKKGYTFQGWETAVYDMSTLDTSINGTAVATNGKLYRVKFSYGYVYGNSLCSKTPNTVSVVDAWYDTIEKQKLDTTPNSGQYCYCQITDIKPIGSEKVYESSSLRWVFRYPFESSCFSDCASWCGNYVKNSSDFRTALYGSNQ